MAMEMATAMVEVTAVTLRDILFLHRTKASFFDLRLASPI
jgi:hypothetical protein